MNFDEQLALSIQPSRNHCQTLSATKQISNKRMHKLLGWPGLGGLGCPGGRLGVAMDSTQDLPCGESTWLGMLGWDGWLG